MRERLHQMWSGGRLTGGLLVGRPPQLVCSCLITTSTTWEASFVHGFFPKNFRVVKKKKKSLTLLNPSIDIQRAYTVTVFILIMRNMYHLGYSIFFTFVLHTFTMGWGERPGSPSPVSSRVFWKPLVLHLVLCLVTSLKSAPSGSLHRGSAVLSGVLTTGHQD